MNVVMDSEMQNVNAGALSLSQIDALRVERMRSNAVLANISDKPQGVALVFDPNFDRFVFINLVDLPIAYERSVPATPELLTVYADGLRHRNLAPEVADLVERLVYVP